MVLVADTGEGRSANGKSGRVRYHLNIANRLAGWVNILAASITNNDRVSPVEDLRFNHEYCKKEVSEGKVRHAINSNFFRGSACNVNRGASKHMAGRNEG